MLTTWILEDDPQLADLLRLVLEQEEHRVETFSDPSNVREALRFAAPDVLLVDMDVNTLDAATFCRSLREDPRWGELPVLVLGQDEGVATRCRMLAAGADDVIAKPFDSLELVLRIRARVRRGRRTMVHAPAPPLRAGDIVLDLGTHMATVGNREVALTQAEFSILSYLLSRPGRAVNAETLLIEALGYPPRVGNPEIVRTHVRNLRQKIEVDPARPTRLVNIPRVGYIIRSAQGRLSA